MSYGTYKANAIDKAVARKEQGISNYQKQQEVSIAVTSAMRDAVAWCINHPDWKVEQSPEERFAWIDRVVRDFLEFSARNRFTYGEIYERIKDRMTKLREEEEIDRELEETAEYIEDKTIQLEEKEKLQEE